LRSCLNFERRVIENGLSTCCCRTVKEDKVKLNKKVREPRYAIQMRNNVEVMEDGYK
jgi:hypothetical protein